MPEDGEDWGQVSSHKIQEACAQQFGEDALWRWEEARASEAYQPARKQKLKELARLVQAVSCKYGARIAHHPEPEGGGRILGGKAAFPGCAAKAERDQASQQTAAAAQDG